MCGDARDQRGLRLLQAKQSKLVCAAPFLLLIEGMMGSLKCFCSQMKNVGLCFLKFAFLTIDQFS